MRAWVLHETGGPGSFKLEELPDPEPGPGEVLVRPVATGLNHLDLWVSMGLPAPKEFPHVAGADASGVVDALGDEVDSVAVGDEVVVNPSVSCGHCDACVRGEVVYCRSYRILGEHRHGTLADLVAVPARNVYRRPQSLSWEEAGAFGLVTGTAFRMLRRARLSAGEVLLVVGAGGGVSSAAVTLGVEMGATVYVTSRSEEKIARAMELGAAGGFDSAGSFSEELVREAGRQADVVLENVGPATWSQSLRSARAGGRIVVCGSTSGAKVELTIPVLFFRQLEIIGSSMFNPDEFEQAIDLVGSGRVPVLVDSVFEFEDLPAALERLGGGEQFGKVVVRHS